MNRTARALRCTWFVLILIALLVNACGSGPGTPAPTATALAVTPASQLELPALPAVFPKIDRHPDPVVWQFNPMTKEPRYDPNSSPAMFGIIPMDLRSQDLSRFDLHRFLYDLTYATFDSKTIWPAAGKLPKEFEVQRMLEMNKNPGSGISKLHALGITGRGVGIAMIDQALLVDHSELVNSLKLYEETADIQGDFSISSMHGTAMASIAVGKTSGVAPEADLYYIANAICENDDGEVDFACLAASVRRILDLNQQLPEGRKIRVLSISSRWTTRDKGYQAIADILKEAESTGMMVITGNADKYAFLGLGRSPLVDPEPFTSYEPGLADAKGYFDTVSGVFHNQIYVPMDSHTLASPTGVDDFAFYRQGSTNWCVPYIAGLYALAVQVKPDLTPADFWALALKSGTSIHLKHNNKNYTMGPIIDPAAIITALQAGK